MRETGERETGEREVTDRQVRDRQVRERQVRETGERQTGERQTGVKKKKKITTLFKVTGCARQAITPFTLNLQKNKQETRT